MKTAVWEINNNYCNSDAKASQNKGGSNMKKNVAAVAAIAVGGVLSMGTLAMAGENYSLGICFQDITNPIFAEFSSLIQEKGEEAGWDVTVLDCKSNAAEEITQVENFIEKGIDALIIYPVEVEALNPVCQEASDKGIKVFSWDDVVDSADMAFLVDNYTVGKAIGTETGKWINENYDGKCEVAVIDYASLPVIVERANGIIDGIKETAPEAEIVAQDSAVDAASGMQLAENMLQAHPDIKVFSCIGDGGAVGANEALKASGANLDEYGVFGCDASEEACAAIQNNEALRMSISLGTPAEWVDIVMENLELLLEDGTYEKEIYKVATPINADNVDEYLASQK